MEDFQYSERYQDDQYEYRHVIVPPDKRPYIPRKLMTEAEWRDFGLQMSKGWTHYARHPPEPYVLLFRRDINK